MRIKNWSKFQHFKDRRPPWVKLYRDLLDDKEWHKLDAKPAKLLVSLWLIASEFDGALPDIETLSWRLRLSEKEVSDGISKLSHWLEQDDIKLISPQHQGDAPERETEVETEAEEPTVLVGSAAELPYRVPPCPHEEISKAYAESLPMLPQIAVMSEQRKSHVTARWKAVCSDGKLSREQGLDWFRDFFGVVAKTPFLRGGGKPDRDTGRVWAADFDWLMLPTNFVKVVEGRYSDRRAA